MIDESLNFAVIGLGNISIRHRGNLKKLFPKAKVYAVSASGRTPSEIIENADKVLSSIDEIININPKFVIVASPATFHAEHAIPFIQAGIPVLIEKPLSASTIESHKILAAADLHKTPVAVGYCLRYLSSSQEIKRLLDNKIVGKVYNVFVEIGQFLPDWRLTKNYRDSVSASSKLGGGALLELSHELDYIQWLFGELNLLSAILRSSKELSLEVEDLADILAKTSKRSVVSIHLDFLQKQAYRKCRVLGSEGVLEWNLIKNQITLTNKEKNELIFDASNTDKNQMYLDMLLDFENMINTKPNQCITLNEAHQTISFIDEIKKTAILTSNI